MLTDQNPSPADILAEWRAAERELADCPEGAPEYDALAARILDLARAYREASRSPDRQLLERDGLALP